MWIHDSPLSLISSIVSFLLAWKQEIIRLLMWGDRLVFASTGTDQGPAEAVAL